MTRLKTENLGPVQTARGAQNTRSASEGYYQAHFLIDRSFMARNNVFTSVLRALGGISIYMNDFNRKVDQATARVGRTVGETTERLEQEAQQFIKYLNDEVVPAVRQHSTKALRVAAQKMQDLANYMEQHSARK